MNTVKEYCTFWAGDHLFGIEVAMVQEVLAATSVTRVPLTTDVVSGLINLRGQIVLAIDLRARLGMEASPSAAGVNLVLRTEQELVCLQADQLGDVVQVERPVASVPPTVRGRLRELVTGVVKRDNELLLILDAARVLDCEMAEVKEQQ